MTFEEVAVGFSPEEWAELVPWQRELHREVMCDNFELVASLGEGTGCGEGVPRAGGAQGAGLGVPRAGLGVPWSRERSWRLSWGLRG